ncbi:MAG: hypothetical protein FJZ01_28640, partial [Candidatus Sericytochromatia bacterium]|nr:hypothetical protein [Candidatus Tanganyikabacteria bacterium]
MRAVSLLVAAVAVASCVPGRAGFDLMPLGDRLLVSGEVDLAALPAGRAAKATLGDVTAAAAVSLIDPASGNTVKTALTNASGVFLLSGFGSAFAPATGALYYLEAVKGLGSHAVGRNAARLRTLLRWSGTGWDSLTAGTVKVGLASTALAALYGLKSGLAANKRISAADLVGTLGSGGFSPV